MHKLSSKIGLLFLASLFVFTGCGSDSSDTKVESANKSIIEKSANSAPVALFDTFSINENIVYDGQLTATDADGDELSFVITQEPKYGRVEMRENGYFTYTPNEGYKGSDTFCYKVSDDVSSCAVKSVTIDVCEKPVDIPNAPTNFKAKALSKLSIELTWDDNSDNEDGFSIYKNGKLVSSVGKNCTKKRIYCLEKNTIYNFEIKANNSAGSSELVDVKGATKDGITIAFFGDKMNNKVLMVDVENMKLLDETENAYTGHEITYALNFAGSLPKVYVSNRGSNAIDVVDEESLKIVKTIEMQHFPRSSDAINSSQGLVAVSGMDKPMVSIIDICTDTVVAVVGDNVVTGPVDSKNGSHACGHPYWLNKNHFVLIDRGRKLITTYKIEKGSDGKWKTTKLSTLNSPTTSHHLVPRNYYCGDKNAYYLINDGSDTIYPSVMELVFKEGKGLGYSRELILKNENVNIGDMGLHHGDFVPNSNLMYVGSKEGTMFVVDYEKMSVKSSFTAGIGAGHTKMIPAKNLAVIINHKDKFITVSNSVTNEFIKNIIVSDIPDYAVGIFTTQAHTEYFVSKDAKYFYMFLTEEGKFIKIDLDSLSLVDSLFVGGKPTMGTFR